ncbi:hypothetical protein DFH29DRAFT_1066991 [Suillus ampliporus]|nr:hypothetical protein DFH29DRAFT_1066991 [Suillus ampliporus]
MKNRLALLNINTQTTAERLAQQLARYYVMHTVTMMHSKAGGIGPAFIANYDAALAEWKSSDYYPHDTPPDDQNARDELYTKCETIYAAAESNDATTIRQWLKVGFSVALAVTALRHHEIYRQPKFNKIL